MATQLKSISDKKLAFVTSILLAGCWVGSYQYRYNVTAFNTYGINIWAFTLWSITGYLTLRLMSITKKHITQTAWHLPIVWVLYIGILLAGEYIGYYILHIHEQNAGPGDALIWGLVHGTRALHTYYLAFPFVIIAAGNILANSIGWVRRIALLIQISSLERKYKTWP